jgi:hypothetical protein
MVYLDQALGTTHSGPIRALRVHGLHGGALPLAHGTIGGTGLITPTF